MKKLTILLLILMMMVSLVGATEICEDSIQPNNLCKLVTPYVTDCSDFTYNIYNKTGDLIETGNLTNFDGNISIYEINFTQPKGSYLVKLCDNTTRELYVGVSGINEVSGSMGWLAIALLMVSMTGFMGWGANMIREDGLKHVKRLLFVLFVVNTFMLGIIGFFASVNSFEPENFETIGIGYAGVNVFLIFAFILNYTWLTLYNVFNKGKDNFRKAFEERNPKKRYKP